MIRWFFGEAPADRVLPSLPGISRPVRLVMAVLAFLAVVLLAVGLTGVRLETGLGEPRLQSATLQIAAGAEIEAEARAALDVLRRTEGILSVRVMDIEEQRALLETWLGSGSAVDGLPLPLMIDIATDPTRLDIPALESALESQAPNAVFDDHGALRSELGLAARGVWIFAFGTAAIVGLALAAVLFLAARASVLGCQDAIRTLRLIGARDGFVAGILARRMTRAALQASLAGTLAGLVLLFILPSESRAGFYLSAVAPHGPEWFVPCLVPVFAAALGWLAARRTIRRTIRQWS